jgi:hypothetical protein
MLRFDYFTIKPKFADAKYYNKINSIIASVLSRFGDSRGREVESQSWLQLSNLVIITSKNFKLKRKSR